MRSWNLYSQTNNDRLRAVFYKHFSNKLAPVLLDVYESLTSWVLPLEQERLKTTQKFWKIESHTLSTISYIKDVSNKLNKNLSEYF